MCTRIPLLGGDSILPPLGAPGRETATQGFARLCRRPPARFGGYPDKIIKKHGRPASIRHKSRPCMSDVISPPLKTRWKK